MIVGIAGTAFRQRDNQRWLTPHRWTQIWDIYESLMPEEEFSLVSGGAAGIDQVAVLAHLFGIAGHKPALHLALPCRWQAEEQMYEFNYFGKTANYYHTEFSLKMRKDKGFSLRRIHECMESAKVTYHQGFEARNLVVGDCDLLIAATFSKTTDLVTENPEYSGTGGTWHCWRNSRAPRKVLINLLRL